MGNTAGNFAFEIENGNSVYPGAKLKGRLILDVRREVTADAIDLYFIGVEGTSITRGESDVHGRAVIHSSVVSLKTFAGGSVTDGHYSFPFEFSIPQGLPKSASGGSWKISYHCVAMLSRGGTLAENVKNSCVVIMNEEPCRSLPTKSTLFGPTTSRVTFMCINPRGTMTFGGIVNSTSLGTNEKLRINFEICNESTSRIKAVNISITRYVTIRTQNDAQCIVSPVSRLRVCVAHMVGTNPVRKDGDGDVDGVDDHSAILKQINEGKYLWGVYVPIDMIKDSSYCGKLINIRYELTVSVRTTFGTTNTSIKIPMTFAVSVPKVVVVPAAVLTAFETPKIPPNDLK